MKKCSFCEIEKPKTEFSKASRERDGLQYNCKPCNKERSAKHRAENPEKERIRHAKYHAINKEKINKNVSEWQKNNREKCRSRSRRFYAKHTEREKERMRIWSVANKEWKDEYHRQWSDENPDYIKQYMSRYQQENRGLVNANTAKYRATKKKSTPYWADLDIIKSIYFMAAYMSKKSGIPHHVDHIIPLKSELVCGLHCEQNLQILTGSENIRKNNSFVSFSFKPS